MRKPDKNHISVGVESTITRNYQETEGVCCVDNPACCSIICHIIIIFLIIMIDIIFLIIMIFMIFISDDDGVGARPSKTKTAR